MTRLHKGHCTNDPFTMHPRLREPKRSIMDFAHSLMFWRWPRRYRCHDSIDCCQYTDGRTCN